MKMPIRRASRLLALLGARMFFQQCVKLVDPCLYSNDRLFRRGIGDGVARVEHLLQAFLRRFSNVNRTACFLAILVSDAMQWSKELGLSILACINR
jgi:hypothetical protein